MNFANRLKKLREDRGLIQQDIADLLHVGRATIAGYETKGKQPDYEKLNLLAEYFNVSIDYLLGREDIPTQNSMPIRINVYGSIPAGIPLEAIQDIQDWEEIPEEWTKGGQEFIALKVKGDSMYPKYLEGDTVIIQLQQDCETGQDCACYVNGYEATLKSIKKEEGKITLLPINPNYAPSTYKHPGEVTILGIVKEIRRKV